MRHEPVLAGVDDREVLLQPLGHVVRVQDRHLCCLGQPVAAHQRDVNPRDRQDARAAVGRGGDRSDRVLPAQVRDGVPRQERRQMRGHADRAHAGPAAPVRDAEGLMQIEVAHVGADVPRPAEPDLGVHVRAVHVDLAAVLVDDPADAAHALLEHPVGGRVGDHQRGQPIAVLSGLGLQIAEINVAALVAGHYHDLEPGHDRAGRIGAVG